MRTTARKNAERAARNAALDDEVLAIIRCYSVARVDDPVRGNQGPRALAKWMDIGYPMLRHSLNRLLAAEHITFEAIYPGGPEFYRAVKED